MQQVLFGNFRGRSAPNCHKAGPLACAIASEMRKHGGGIPGQGKCHEGNEAVGPSRSLEWGFQHDPCLWHFSKGSTDSLCFCPSFVRSTQCRGSSWSSQELRPMLPPFGPLSGHPDGSLTGIRGPGTAEGTMGLHCVAPKKAFLM